MWLKSRLLLPCRRGSKGRRLGGDPGGGVDVLRGCLRRHLDDPGFVDDAGCAVSFLYDPDDPRLVALAVFGGLDLGAEAGGLLSGETDEEAS